MSQNEVEKTICKWCGAEIFRNGSTWRSSGDGCELCTTLAQQPSEPLPEPSLPPLVVTEEDKAWGRSEAMHTKFFYSKVENTATILSATSRQVRELTTSLTQQAAEVEELKGEVAELSRKGGELCCAYGNALIRIGDLERDPMMKVMEMGIVPSPTGWRNARAEELESQLLALRKPSEGLPERPKGLRTSWTEVEKYLDALEAIIRERNVTNRKLNREKQFLFKRKIKDTLANRWLPYWRSCRRWIINLEQQLKEAKSLASKSRAEGEQEGIRGIYVASRASIPERAKMWKDYQWHGFPIISTWIDEAGEGETADLSELWKRIADEVRASCALVLYVEPGDLPLKGALIEVGMALALGKRVFAVMPGVDLEERSMRPVGSWLRHPLVTICPAVDVAINAAKALLPATETESAGPEKQS